MNIFKQEFKMKFRSALIWSVALVALIFLYISVGSSMTQDAALMNEMFSAFPDELLMAFGMDNIDLSTVLGFYGVVFTFVQICLAVQASNYGFGLVSVEERDMTADFLMAKPVSRAKIMSTKLLAALAALSITNAVVWATSFIALNMFSRGRSFETDGLILVLSSIILFQLVFLGLGMVISLFVKRVRAVTPYSMGLTFGLYILNAFGGMLGKDSIDLITPFKHFEPSTILSTASFDTPLVMISVVLIIGSIAGSYYLYGKRNIHTAV